MSRLIGGLQSLTSKVTDTATRAAAGLGDGVAKVANKTEEAAKRVNRTVNPLSSHFQQPRDGGSSGSHAAGSEVNESAGRGEGSFVVAGDGMSIKEAKVLAESIKDAVTGEIEALHEEKREHLGKFRPPSWADDGRLRQGVVWLLVHDQHGTTVSCRPEA